MPFPTFIFFKYHHKDYNNASKIERKEEGFDFSQYTTSCNWEKASASASAKGRLMRGSVTVEAVFCVPLFFYAAVCLIWMLEIRAIQLSVRAGLQEAGRTAASEFYEMPVLIPAKLEADIVNEIGEDRLDGSLVEGGSEGLHCERSYAMIGSGIMQLKVSYRIKIPIPIFAIPTIACSESMRMKGWNGYEKQIFSENEDKMVVYITETGIVYHKDSHCTYLEPSVRAVPADGLEALRNQDGGKYYLCEHCGRYGQAQGVYYITEYGDRYHTTAMCSGLKRKIYAVPIEEAKGKGACSKCGR